MNVKKTKKFKENRPENYHVRDNDAHLGWDLKLGPRGVVVWVGLCLVVRLALGKLRFA